MQKHNLSTQADSTDVFGFWLYILTDCVIFASLFATFLVLNKPMSYGPALSSLINLDFALGETFVLLASNFCFGLAALAIGKNKIKLTQFWLVITFILGAAFIAMELYEFIEFTHHGYTYQTSGGSASFYTLVGTHGVHVAIGLVWIILTIIQLSVKKLETDIKRRMVYLGLFWNFLDIVWIFLFSFVYLLGVL